jgi:hypothetical protein
MANRAKSQNQKLFASGVISEREQRKERLCRALRAIGLGEKDAKVMSNWLALGLNEEGSISTPTGHWLK